MMRKRSKQRWLVLWKRIGARGNTEKIYANLMKRYAEPHRVYHALPHIEDCLDQLEEARHLAANPDAIEMALWYHDAIYDIKAKNNEEKSAELALVIAEDASLPDNFGKRVVSLILATKHDAIPIDPDAKIIIDIDLSILGQSEEKFDEYERQIREEYKRVPENEFVTGRSAILKLFLKRPTIYLTQFFRDKYEAQAQKNITRSLAYLKASMAR